MHTFGSKACIVLVALSSVENAMAVDLPSYNVDPGSVSVSGLSSGGFMAAQLGIAYSGTFRTGFGVFAGGPFDCARNQQVSGSTLLIDLRTASHKCPSTPCV